MKKETKEFITGGVVILAIILFFVSGDNEEIKTTTIKDDKNISLKEYKTLSKKEREIIISNTIKNKNWDISLKDDYINCMGDFAYNKNEQLAYSEVIEWCKDEKERKFTTFKSHFNELDAPDMSTTAFVLCKNEVKEKLISPASADFPFLDRTTWKKGKNRYVIKSYVDSKNAYGTEIRNTWHCSAEYKGKNFDETQYNPNNWSFSLEFY